MIDPQLQANDCPENWKHSALSQFPGQPVGAKDVRRLPLQDVRGTITKSP